MNAVTERQVADADSRGSRRQVASISVLMSTYSGEQSPFLHEALESCVKQDLCPAQIVLVLDGPVGADQHQVLEAFAHTAHCAGVRLTIVPLERNVGLSSAMNAGLPHCTEPYVARMDSDDLCDRRRFLAQWELLVKRPDVDVVASWQADFENDPSQTFQIKSVPEHHEDIVKVLRWRNAVPHPSIVFKRDLVRNLGGYRPLLYLEDYELFMRLIRAGAHFYAIQQPLIRVRVTRSQRSRRGGWQYTVRDARFRWSLYRIGDISLSNCLISVVAYAAFRLAPAALKHRLYRAVRHAPPVGNI